MCNLGAILVPFFLPEAFSKKQAASWHLYEQMAGDIFPLNTHTHCYLSFSPPQAWSHPCTMIPIEFPLRRSRCRPSKSLGVLSGTVCLSDGAALAFMAKS